MNNKLLNINVANKMGKWVSEDDWNTSKAETWKDKNSGSQHERFLTTDPMNMKNYIQLYAHSLNNLDEVSTFLETIYQN